MTLLPYPALLPAVPAQALAPPQRSWPFLCTHSPPDTPLPPCCRFLIAAREEVSSTQLRDDLLSMLVAGHETTASVLTWTMYLLVQNPDKMAIAQVGPAGLGCCGSMGLVLCGWPRGA